MPSLLPKMCLYRSSCIYLACNFINTIILKVHKFVLCVLQIVLLINYSAVLQIFNAILFKQLMDCVHNLL